MGKLFDEIQESKAQIGKKSRIAEILEVLSEEDAKDLMTALDDHSIPGSNISKAMEKRGHRLSVSVISRYRRGDLAVKLK